MTSWSHRLGLAAVSIGLAIVAGAPVMAQTAALQERAEPAGPPRPPVPEAIEERIEAQGATGAERPAAEEPRRERPAVEPRRARGWTTYRNERHGFRFEYPADFFTSDVVLPDGSGETLKGADGRSRLAAFSLPNPEGLSLSRVAANYLREAGDPEVTYQQRTRRGHLVISGNRGDDVFYLRIAQGASGVQGVELSYPRDRERDFDRIVTRVSRSFRPGR